MPELPEVEAVRAGLARHLTGRTIRSVEVLDPRPLRRQVGGPEAFAAGLAGRTVRGAVRRGKLLWLPLDDSRALVAHLGMSGQLLVRGTSARAERGPDGAAPDGLLGHRAEGRAADLTATRAPSLVRELSSAPRHLRVRILLEPAEGDAPDGPALELVDQRMLGGLRLVELVPSPDGLPGGFGSGAALIPADSTHIARDLLDPALDWAVAVERMRVTRRAVKTVLLDQGIVSGIGSIYADEGLWAARVRGSRPASSLSARAARAVLEETAAVMRRALEVGGTSFDALYVDADGAPGFFSRELRAYGRAGEPCLRCGRPLRSEVVGGRSHVFCPGCQRGTRRAQGREGPGTRGTAPR